MQRNRKAQLAATAMAVAMLGAACSSTTDVAAADESTATTEAEAAMEDDAMEDEATDNGAMEDDEAMADDAMEDGAVAYAFDGLEPLGDDAVYQGWLIVDDAPVSTGRFSVDAAGRIIPDGDVVKPAHAANASAVVLTIEPS